MAENLNPDSDKIDEMLAKFTDQLLAGTAPDLLAGLSDPEMIDLQKMVMRLNQVVGHSQPTQAMSKKIWGNLASQWQKDGFAAPPESLWQRWQRQATSIRSTWMSGDRRQLYVSVAALAVVIVLIILAPDLSDINNPLPGAARAGDILTPIILLAGLVIVGVIGWWLRNRR